MNQTITAGRMNSLLSCPRKHFWGSEVGLTQTETKSLALRFGSAWARGMEARWHKKAYPEALAFAVPVGVDLDAYEAEKVAALLAAYYDYWGEIENCVDIIPEVRVGPRQLEGTEFFVDGMMDGLGSLEDGRSALVESKTCSESLDPDSRYWLRLRFNVQVWNYTTEARRKGWDVQVIYYDVTRKPMLKPKKVADLDLNKKKIVVDENGQRVLNKNGSPRQTGDEEKGWKLKEHIETPSEYADRLYHDVMKRPDFYFCRREVPVIDDEVEAFERHRLAMAKLISHYRDEEEDIVSAPDVRDPEAWPRNVSKDTCGFCPYSSFCLQNISVDLNHPPAGFEVRPFNPELREENYDTDATEETDTAH